MLDNLPKPFFVLAPMDDVTDTVFRQLIADIAPPDLFFTEFVNVDALQSKGREATLRRLKFTKKEKPVIAQLWGLKPENFYKTAKGLADGTLTDEANWYDRRTGLDKVQGSKEKRANRTRGTVSESRTKLTQQFAKSSDRVNGSASKQVAAVSTSGMGYDGIDLNFGCPDKNVVRNGACSALMLPANRERAREIIEATREGASAGQRILPVSVKTRLGFSEVDKSWHEFLLNLKLNALSIHGRTKNQLSNVPANWEEIGKIREIRDQLSPTTLIIGNGDVMTRAQGSRLASQYSLDGIMIGRGVFHDPFVFAQNSPWGNYTKEQRVGLYRKHVELFAKTYTNDERKVHVLGKFCKIYINGFDGAKELREQLMAAKTPNELLELLN